MSIIRSYIEPEIVDKKNKIFYVKGVNIAYSFDTLERICTDQGGEVEKGDYLIVDNKNGDKRKAFKKLENGSIIMYARVLKGREFSDLGEGQLKGKKPLIDWFGL